MNDISTYPAFMRFWAIGQPIIPRPRKPMRAGTSSNPHANKKNVREKTNKLCVAALRLNPQKAILYEETNVAVTCWVRCFVGKNMFALLNEVFSDIYCIFYRVAHFIPSKYLSCHNKL